jgi:uncharacterized phage-associated protein
MKRRNKNMAAIIDVAKYILEQNGSMTTMKLQKLCYYSQAWSLAWEGKPLFPEDFQAWANGPVCPQLFNFHRGKFIVNTEDFPQLCGCHKLTDEEKDIIDRVLEFYGDKEAHWLSELTHKERPWREARQKANALPGDLCDEVIAKDSMEDYYSGL